MQSIKIQLHKINEIIEGLMQQTLMLYKRNKIKKKTSRHWECRDHPRPATRKIV